MDRSYQLLVKSNCYFYQISTPISEFIQRKMKTGKSITIQIVYLSNLLLTIKQTYLIEIQYMFES